MKFHKNALFILIGFLAACKPASAALPVEDINAIRTQAVQTAVMEMTVQAVLHPIASPLPVEGSATPTLKLEPGLTPIPLTEAINTDTGDQVVIPVISGVIHTPVVYQCEFVSQSPLDKPQAAGANYDMIWTIRNTGIATWNTREYQVKWLGGSDLSPRHQYPLPGNVAPSNSVEIIVDIKIPPNPSDAMLVTRWGIVNDNGDVFCKFYHAVPTTYPAPIRTSTPAP